MKQEKALIGNMGAFLMGAKHETYCEKEYKTKLKNLQESK
jgi:hypothetical protein